MGLHGKAAFADEQGGQFTIRDSEDWNVEDDEVKIKVHAVTINPADHKILVSIGTPCLPTMLLSV